MRALVGRSGTRRLTGGDPISKSVGYKFQFHGVRGSYPVSGESYVRHGGHTSCVSIETDRGILVIDAGTGITALGHLLAERDEVPPVTILFTHFHLDHVIGMPSFQPLLQKTASFTLMADAAIAPGWRERLAQITGQPFWPVALDEQGAAIRFEDFPEDRDQPMNVYGIQITRCPVWHPQGSLAYRFRIADADIVYGTDRECGNEDQDKPFLEFAKGTRILIHDAQYTPEEYIQRLGWGHSTWEQAAAVASELNVEQLVLTSHDPHHTDSEIDAIVQLTQARFSNTIAAREGLVISG